MGFRETLSRLTNSYQGVRFPILSILDGSLNPVNVVKVIKHNHDFYKSHPGYFRPEGLLVFCEEQGSGKTLSAVQYVKRLCEEYPHTILCTNVQINGLSPATVFWQLDILMPELLIPAASTGRELP